MGEFLSWFGSTIGFYWDWLCHTDVPGCTFTFGALFLGVFFVNFALIILQFVIRKDNGGKESK